MKFVLFLALAVVAVSARPQKETTVINADTENDGSGNYKFNYALSDGTNRQESGALKTVGDVQAQTSEGVISWEAPNGEIITLRYKADENGYQPIGDHLPK